MSAAKASAGQQPDLASLVRDLASANARIEEMDGRLRELERIGSWPMHATNYGLCAEIERLDAEVAGYRGILGEAGGSRRRPPAPKRRSHLALIRPGDAS